MTDERQRLADRIEALAKDCVDPKGRTMDRWDVIRQQVEKFKGSDLPRMNFETIMEDFAEILLEAAVALRAQPVHGLSSKEYKGPFGYKGKDPRSCEWCGDNGAPGCDGRCYPKGESPSGLGQPAPVLGEEEVKQIIRRELTDEQNNYTLGVRSTHDVLLAGCKAVGYGVPTSPETAADRFAGFVARAILSRLQAPVVPEGWQLVPTKITPEIACALEDCGPPDMQTPEALAELIRMYQPMWDGVLAAASTPPKDGRE